MKIGFLGGSFDPVHFGHLMAAQDAREQLGLDRVLLVPAAQAPLKPADTQAGPEDRLALLRAAVEGDPRFEVSEVELRRGGVSYTIDTVRHFRALHPRDELFWIIGGDQLPQLPRWKESAELVRLVAFVVLERPGYPSPGAPELPGLRLHRITGHVMGVSSTELRDRVRRNLSLDYFMPSAAIKQLKDRNLYR